MVGFVVGASTLTGVLVKLPAGAWSDLLGRRPLLILGAVVFATMPFTHLGVGSLAALVAVRFVHGAATAIFGPVASASLSDLAPARRRATWLSTHAAVQGGASARSRHRWVSDRPWALRPGFRHCRLRSSGHAVFAAAWARRVSQSVLKAKSRAASSRSAVSHRFLITSLAQAAQFVLHGTLNAFLPLFARCHRADRFTTRMALRLPDGHHPRDAAGHGHTVRPHRPTRCHRRGSLAVAPRCGSSRRPPG